MRSPVLKEQGALASASPTLISFSDKAEGLPARKAPFQDAPRFFFPNGHYLFTPHPGVSGLCHVTGEETSPEWFLELSEDTE